MKANLCLEGRLVQDPRLIPTKSGTLIVELFLVFQSSYRYPPLFMNFISVLNDLSEYLLENFKKGDDIEILRSSPAPKNSRKMYTKEIKFLVWDIAEKGTNIPLRGDFPGGVDPNDIPMDDDDDDVTTREGP